MELKHSGQALLQALMARGSMTLSEAQQVLAVLLGIDRADEPDMVIELADIDAEMMDNMVQEIHDAIHAFDYDIRKHQHQVTGEDVWAFVNVDSDPATQLATTRSADEISFIKRLLEAILKTNNKPRMELMCVTEDQALKLSRPPRNRESIDADGASQAGNDKGLKHSEVLALMASLVEERWLERSATGFYSLSPRAILELRSWMLEMYNDPDERPRIKQCVACKDVITVGQRCSNLDCDVRLHDICDERFWRTRRDHNCPDCRTRWEGNVFVGEKAVTQTERYRRSRQRGGGRAGDAVRSVIEEAEDGAEEEDEDEDDDMAE